MSRAFRMSEEIWFAFRRQSGVALLKFVFPNSLGKTNQALVRRRRPNSLTMDISFKKTSSPEIFSKVTCFNLVIYMLTQTPGVRPATTRKASSHCRTIEVYKATKVWRMQDFHTDSTLDFCIFKDCLVLARGRNRPHCSLDRLQYWHNEMRYRVSFLSSSSFRRYHF